ncbi:MAG: hypothetical protein IPP51_03870 [Bacteroidetes bacterium]|nr:hypothetical protein [Bacteroidota bacterium]
MTKKFTLLVCASLFFTIQLLAQIDVKTIDMGKLNQAKLDGKLNGHEKYVNYDVQGKNPSRVSSNSTGNNTVNTASGCNCWVARDASWQVAQFDGSGGSGGPGSPPDYRNDDWSTVNLPLPFFLFLWSTS